MPPKVQKSKEAKAKAAAAGGQKSKKKKWGKGKMREKANHLVLLDKKTDKALRTELPKMKLITLSVVIERYNCGGSLARKCLRQLASEGLIKAVCNDSKGRIYTRATKQVEGEEEVEDE